jgi:hypothetical protein
MDVNELDQECLIDAITDKIQVFDDEATALKEDAAGETVVRFQEKTHSSPHLSKDCSDAYD